LATLALAAPARAADVNKFLPDDAEIIMVLNVQQIIQSPLVQKHGLPHVKQFLQADEKVKKLLETVGFDPLTNLTRVTAAASAVSPDAKGAIIAEGKFNLDKIRSKVEELANEKKDNLKIITEGDHKLLEIKNPGEEKPAYAALINENTIVFGSDKGFVLDSFDRASDKKKQAVKPDIVKLIEKADQTQSMWMVAPGAVFAKSPLAEDEKTKKILESVNDLSVGFKLDDNFNMATAIVTKDAKAAQQISEELKNGIETLKGLLALLAGQTKELAPLVDVVGSIKVGTENATVTLKSEVSKEMIEKSLKKDS
jgi:hypothetical protein